jgi:hypothetical protein
VEKNQKLPKVSFIKSIYIFFLILKLCLIEAQAQLFFTENELLQEAKKGKVVQKVGFTQKEDFKKTLFYAQLHQNDQPFFEHDTVGEILCAQYAFQLDLMPQEVLKLIDDMPHYFKKSLDATHVKVISTYPSSFVLTRNAMGVSIGCLIDLETNSQSKRINIEVLMKQFVYVFSRGKGLISIIEDEGKSIVVFNLVMGVKKKTLDKFNFIGIRNKLEKYIQSCYKRMHNHIEEKKTTH